MDLTSQLVIGKRFALLFGAAFILAVAIVLHVEYLYYISLALAVTPLIAYIWGARMLHGIAAERDMPEVVTAGEVTTMRLALTNNGGTRRLLLVVKDNLPSGLVAQGSAERVVTDLAPGETAQVEYPLTARRRGIYLLGYADVYATDPLGMFAYHRELETLGKLVVHPRPVPLPPVKPPSGGRLISSRSRARRRGDGTDFAGVREYTPGDDLRRIHWKSTAKRGKLTIVQYESGEANNVVVALDLSPRFHAGEEDESTIEYGVTLAASIASQCLRRGAEFSLLAEGRESHSLWSLASPQAEASVMDALAAVQPNAPRSFAETLVAAEPWLPPGAGVVVISPAHGPEAVAAAQRLTALGHGVLWVSLVGSSFEESAERSGTEEDYAEVAMALAGVRCAVRQVRRGDDLGTQMGVRSSAA